MILNSLNKLVSPYISYFALSPYIGHSYVNEKIHR